jgi:hypothetical protein
MNYISENKHAITFIENLPEYRWLDICNTDDRVNTFYLVQDIYWLIAYHLKNFSECQEPEEIDTICTNKILIKLTKDRAEEYQLIYSALLKAWKYVEADLLEIQKLSGNPINQVNFTILGFLLSICNEDAKNMLEDIIFPERVTGNNYAEYSTSHSYQTFIEANKIVRTGESSRQWEKNVQLYHKRYPKRKLCMDLLKIAALKDPSIRPCLDDLDKFHGLAQINAPALFHPERTKDYPFSSHTVKDGLITLRPKRPKKS